ncbi:ygbB [Wigglesworthia glossinidia endosymbiont of Glossina brevipalpis]|uniref:2-C-methyl-D-erythritol 2,4-cyclodiphosphate synthase n=1 Tax=Wigglesworthia glossinidia brevipalpis TaxID=36870 RepID=ISPF_WIGBR|nr:RecName: Full=2-C-methyl-D-erythritol 2,4-cyclodiphosphate synthase; Short=MECDP-synthase; Short=MECPP-synthase; Short=MECPS [Wigglesworthia glossinidia endosymbiont of Glossina brevipalpis]BAC24677.1 ygbB [Wigglesworthia glossinidia endosymbiont of Glossina brevipalpis]
MRVGHGFDIHKFGKIYKPLILGGVHIPYCKGVVSHSDGDVIIHSIIDSLLGASSLGDIGILFPNNDIKYKNINSCILLQVVWNCIKKKYKIGNIDVTLFLEYPKISSYTNKICLCISNCLKCKTDVINIKSKTMEGLGEIGKKKGIASEAVSVLLEI